MYFIFTEVWPQKLIIFILRQVVKIMVGRRLKLTESQEFPVKKVTENPILTNHFVIFYCLYEVDQLCFISLKSSLFHMKITLSATKSLHQDCGPRYLPFPFFLTHTLPSSVGK